MIWVISLIISTVTKINNQMSIPKTPYITAPQTEKSDTSQNAQLSQKHRQKSSYPSSDHFYPSTQADLLFDRLDP